MPLAVFKMVFMKQGWLNIQHMYCRRGIALACLGAAIYAVGGLDDSTCYSLVERYDPSVDQWTMVANMNIPRGGVGVTALKVGHNFVFCYETMCIH